MARSRTPALFIGEVLYTDAAGDRGIIAFDSAGAEVRLSLSRHQIGKLAAFARALGQMMDEQPSCEIVTFPRKRRADGKAVRPSA